jgi:hypothetical protein
MNSKRGFLMRKVIVGVILTRRHITYMVRIKIMKRALKAKRFKPEQIVGAKFR